MASMTINPLAIAIVRAFFKNLYKPNLRMLKQYCVCHNIKWSYVIIIDQKDKMTSIPVIKPYMPHRHFIDKFNRPLFNLIEGTEAGPLYCQHTWPITKWCRKDIFSYLLLEHIQDLFDKHLFQLNWGFLNKILFVTLSLVFQRPITKLDWRSYCFRDILK